MSYIPIYLYVKVAPGGISRVPLVLVLGLLGPGPWAESDSGPGLELGLGPGLGSGVGLIRHRMMVTIRVMVRAHIWVGLEAGELRLGSL